MGMRDPYSEQEEQVGPVHWIGSYSYTLCPFNLSAEPRALSLSSTSPMYVRNHHHP